MASSNLVRHIEWLVPARLNANERLLLFTSCDSRYLGYAISLIRSADLFSPGFPFVLHLINPSDHDLDRVRKISLALRSTRLFVSIERTDLSFLGEDQKRAYFASARFPHLSYLLETFKIPIFSIDADSLVVNPIDCNFSDKVDAEVVITRRDLKEEPPEHLSVATGCIWMKPTPGCIRFINSVANEIDAKVKNRELSWFIDQIVFYQQIKLMIDEVRFYNLKRKYADWNFTETSIIWAGKGPRKDYDIRFLMMCAILSDDQRRRSVANQIRFNIGMSEENNSWFLSRIKKATGLHRKIAIFLPRLDLPWKKINASHGKPPHINEDVLDLRLHWKSFAVQIANALERNGESVDVIEIPAWEIDKASVEASGCSLAVIPHRCFLDFPDCDIPILFYMQEFFRWLFVINERGWSAASTVYPVKMDSLPEVDTDYFNDYRSRLGNGSLCSKFKQPERQGYRSMVDEGLLPNKPYIFFPLQIPHDQSIEYFSEVSEEDVVEHIVEWGKKNAIPIVMKPHPANMKSMQKFKKFVDGSSIYWTEAHVYDLIENSSAVYTINSGVGFEALFHLKPVVTFGRVEYDCVSFRATTDSLDSAWEYCTSINKKVIENKYRRFVNWFLGDYAVDLSRPEQARSKIENIAKDIISRI